MATSTIPLARGLPVVGSVFDMARDMRAFLTDSYHELGPVYGMRLLNRRFTVLAGVEANRFLARHGTKHFRSFEFWSGFNAWFGAARSTLSADGAEHAAFRRALKRGYSREYAVEHMSGMIDIARQEIAAWPQDRPMAAVPALQRIVTDQVGTLVAGVSPRPYNDDLVCYVHGLLSATVVPRPYLRWSPRFRRASAQVDKLYHEVIQCHSGTMRERHGAAPDSDRRPAGPARSRPEVLPRGGPEDRGHGPLRRRAGHGGGHLRLHALRPAREPGRAGRGCAKRPTPSSPATYRRSRRSARWTRRTARPWKPCGCIR